MLGVMTSWRGRSPGPSMACRWPRPGRGCRPRTGAAPSTRSGRRWRCCMPTRFRRRSPPCWPLPARPGIPRRRHSSAPISIPCPSSGPCCWPSGCAPCQVLTRRSSMMPRPASAGWPTWTRWAPQSRRGSPPLHPALASAACTATRTPPTCSGGTGASSRCWTSSGFAWDLPIWSWCPTWPTTPARGGRPKRGRAACSAGWPKATRPRSRRHACSPACGCTRSPTASARCSSTVPGGPPANWPLTSSCGDCRAQRFRLRRGIPAPG